MKPKMRQEKISPPRAWVWFSIVLLTPSGAWAKQGLDWNAAAQIGGAGLATDTAAEGVGRFGLDLGVQAHLYLPMLPGLGPTAGYEFHFLPGKSAVHRVEAGLSLRPLLFAGLGNTGGDLVADLVVGYVHAPTVGGDAHWFGFGVELAYLLKIRALGPVRLGPYLKYAHVVFPDAADPIFVTFGAMVAYAATSMAHRPPPPKVQAAPKEQMAEPNLVGKPGDRDGDSVPDASDLCPITAPNTEVDEHGCMALKGRMVFPDVHFAKNSDRLSPKALLALRRLADVLKANPSVVVVVWVYSEKDEPADLAGKRAAHLTELLERFGVSKNRIQAGPVPPGTLDISPPQGPWWPRRVVFRFRLAQ